MIRLDDDVTKKLINDVLDERKKRTIPKISSDPKKAYYLVVWVTIGLVYVLIFSLLVNFILYSQLDILSKIIKQLPDNKLLLNHMSCSELKSVIVDMENNPDKVFGVNVVDIQSLILGKC